jgi:catechol 2,3-dioxygenase-like lactoylglutathione lyase family enzyme
MKNLVGAMRAVTVGVSDLNAALRLFHEVMDLCIEWRRPLDPQRARFYGLPSGTSGEWAELSCQSYPIGRLRLLQLTPLPRGVVRLDTQLGGPDSPLAIGPKAIDFYVAPPIATTLNEMTAAGCTARSRPIRYLIGDTESEELVLFGPDGVPLLLMIGHRHNPRSMRAGTPHGKYSEVPTISVVSGDLAATRAFYGDVLGLTAMVDAEVAPEYRDLACTLVGIPAGSRIHYLMYQDPDEPSGKILLVHFFALSTQRIAGRMHPSMLGVGLYTHDCRSLSELTARAQANGAAIEAPAATVDGERLMLLRGPNGELFEISESATTR